MEGEEQGWEMEGEGGVSLEVVEGSALLWATASVLSSLPPTSGIVCTGCSSRVHPLCPHIPSQVQGPDVDLAC